MTTPFDTTRLDEECETVRQDGWTDKDVVLRSANGIEIIAVTPYPGWCYTEARLNGRLVWAWVSPIGDA